MPELPEVETVVTQLSGLLPGRSIRRIAVLHSDILHESERTFKSSLQGARFQAVSRRGKNILLMLSTPAVLVVNLGMTGQLLFHPPSPRGTAAGGTAPPKHLAVSFSLDDGATLYYADTRRFGSLRRFTPGEWDSESARLGPEPLSRDWSPEELHGALARSRSPMRSWLLDQTRIAGIGNIYACEALFRAGIHPQTPALSVSRAKAGKLHRSIRDVLEEAIRARGTTLRDYRTAAGDYGGFGPSLQAYGREGSPCPRCNTLIQRVVFGNRSAFFCPECQPRE